MRAQIMLTTLVLAISGLVGGNADSEDRPLSAAMRRHTVDDSQNELYTRFRYEPVTGLGYERGVHRRDPSTIIEADDLYYVWYTHCTDPKYKWLNADIWYATSLDGVNWTEKGPAVQRGPKGSWDDFSVFTTNVLVAEGKYYLCYQARSFSSGRNVVGMARADSPDGPWMKLPEPILRTTPDGKLIDANSGYANWSRFEEKGSWDSGAVHDPGILPRWGKYWLYYKGHQIGGTMAADSKWGVAVSEHPEGPYIKSPLNPVTNSGHEIWVWPWKRGIAAIVDWAGPEKDTVQYTEDGVNFEVVASLEDIPPAGGAYVPDKFDDPEDGQGFTWGLCHYGAGDWNFLLRFECDLHRDSRKQLDWKHFRHYSTVREVMIDPERFEVSAGALQGKR